MTSRAVAMKATDERTERYRRAERALWSHYGLEPTERFVEFESPAVRLRIQEVGSGEPIVFVHGGLWPAVALAPLVRELAGYRCILLDRPGCGLSSAVDWRKHELRTVAPSSWAASSTRSGWSGPTSSATRSVACGRSG